MGDDDSGRLFDLVRRYHKERRDVVAARTASNEWYYLLDFARSFGGRDIAKMGKADVERWWNQGGRRYKPSYQNLRLRTVKAFCAWMSDPENFGGDPPLKRNPAAKIKPLRKPRPLPVTFKAWEVEAILAVCPDIRARVIVLLTIQAGLRCIEISRLELGDLAPDLTEARVVGKGGHQRDVYFPHELREVLVEYLDTTRGHSPGGLVLSTQSNQSLKPATIGYLYSRWTRAAGVKKRAWDGKTAHGGRRTAISDMLERGAELQEVAEVAGHASYATLRPYVRGLNGKRMAKVMEGRRYGSPAVRSIGQAG